MKCYLTGHKIYNLNLNEKSDQIFIAYNCKYKNAEKKHWSDAGHPTGTNFDKDELEAFIRLFGKYARIVYDLKNIFDKNLIK